MAVSVTPATKLFTRCTICANNPVNRDVFLVVKKKTLYCINVKNKSIRKVYSPVSIDYYDSLVKYSSNGEYFVICDSEKDIYVFNSISLELIRSFRVSLSSINTEGSTVNIHDIDKTTINDFVIYNEFIICIVNYLQEPYLRHDYFDTILNTGVEVYNILTGELVTNNFNLWIVYLHIINDTILCCVDDKTSQMYQLTPQLELTLLPYQVDIGRVLTNKFHFNGDMLSFSYVLDSGKHFLQSLVLSFNNVKTTRIELDFDVSTKNHIYNITSSPDGKFLLIGMDVNTFTRVLVFNSSLSKCLFYVDIPASKKFYILDDYRIVYEAKGSVHVFDSPLTKTLFAQKISQNTVYSLPDELWYIVLLSL
jgi:hypothetical protein